MSYTYLQEQGEESSAESFSDIPQYALSKLNLTHAESYSNDNATESCHASRSGTMCKPSTGVHGAERSMSCAADFPAKTSAQQERAPESPEREADSGPKWQGSFAKWDQDSYSWKTHQCSLLGGWESFSETWPRWGLMRDGACWEVVTQDCQPSEIVFGLWPAPACSTRIQGKMSAETVKKSCLENGHQIHVSGLLILAGWPRSKFQSAHQWIMGWPIGWTSLKPLAMDKFRKWLSSHGKH